MTASSTRRSSAASDGGVQRVRRVPLVGNSSRQVWGPHRSEASDSPSLGGGQRRTAASGSPLLVGLYGFTTYHSTGSRLCWS
jgi:hypothetical protein